MNLWFRLIWMLLTAWRRKRVGPMETSAIRMRVWPNDLDFLRHGRVLGIVVIRGLFKAPSGPVPPADFAAALGMDPVSPALPDWVLDWNRSCDALSLSLRADEQAAG